MALFQVDIIDIGFPVAIVVRLVFFWFPYLICLFKSSPWWLCCPTLRRGSLLRTELIEGLDEQEAGKL